MDCACLPLLYMDRELFWRSVILFSQSLPSTLLFWGEEYLQSTLHIFQVLLGWLGWMTLNPGGDESLWVSTLSFSRGTLSWRKTMTFSRQAFHVKYLLFPARNLFMSLIFYVFHCMCWGTFSLNILQYSNCIWFFFFTRLIDTLQWLMLFSMYSLPFKLEL